MKALSTECRIVDFETVHDVRGNLAIVEGGRQVPFQIRRVYWIYDVPAGVTRDGHASRDTEECIISLSGSFDVVVDDGAGSRRSFHLNRSNRGLYVPVLTWRHIENFSTNSVCLVMASTKFDLSACIYDYDEYQRARRA